MRTDGGNQDVNYEHPVRDNIKRTYFLSITNYVRIRGKRRELRWMSRVNKAI